MTGASRMKKPTVYLLCFFADLGRQALYDYIVYSFKIGIAKKIL